MHATFFFFFFLPFAKIFLNIKEENFMYFLYCLPIKFISNTNLRACNLESKLNVKNIICFKCKLKMLDQRYQVIVLYVNILVDFSKKSLEFISNSYFFVEMEGREEKSRER